MDSANFQVPNQELLVLEKAAFHGERAREVRDGKDWAWLSEYIFGALTDEAIMTLRNAKTEEDRMKAQQMFLAVEKPKRQLEFLISQGDAARASLAEEVSSTLELQEENTNGKK